tara:strand:+ start:522 stop:1040 length:519 start_codon:yes stop_codon:yes gene_type:complete
MIKGKNVSFRSLEKNDLSILKDWRNSENIRKTTREYRLLNMINQQKWFENLHLTVPPKDIMFGIMKKNNLIGVTGLTYIDWKNKHAEISIYLKLKNWQKTKEAKETIEILKKYAFDELNLHRLWVEIFAIATENRALFKQMKFQEEGILKEKLWRKGQWWDSIVCSIISPGK